MNTEGILTVDESVGANFKEELLEQARDKTLRVIEKASQQIYAGMSESDIKTLVLEIQKELGAECAWHPPQIRVGENTLLPFGKKGLIDPVLKDNDIYFLDLGLVFEGHEGDVGRAFSVGSDTEMAKCCNDVKDIWFEVQRHWQSEKQTGAMLYEFARQSAQQRGWILTLEKANGHRIADFPHTARRRGSISGFFEYPANNRWILEIQIRHPTQPFGAFYEDLLATK